MNFETILWDIKADGILYLVLNRPNKMNAFTLKMCAELEAAYQHASQNNDVKAIVLTGSGKAFCAGMDLSVEGNVFGLNEDLKPTIESIKENYDTDEYINGVRDTGGRVTLAMRDCRKPIIAAINGIGVGIGATMTLAADIRLISTKAKMGFVFGKIGITPEACSTWYLPRLVGLQKALLWCYTADLIDPEDAKDSGLALSIHAPEDLQKAAHDLALKITKNRSMSSVTSIRAMMNNSASLQSPIEAHIIESHVVHFLSQRDGSEGVKAFMEKREPNFSGTTNDEDLPSGFPWTDNS